MIIASVILSIFLNSSSIKQSSKIGLLIIAFISLYFVFPIFNAFLFDGDFIKVSKVDNIAKLPKTNFTETLIEVYVVGEVLKPGKILIKNVYKQLLRFNY